MNQKLFSILALLMLLAGCKEEYDFPLRSADKSVLIVEGFLNAGNAPTTITLSRSLKIDEVGQFKPVLQAQLSVEGKDNTVKQLSPAGNGNYTHPGLALATGSEYRLRIKTPDGKEYLSAWVEARKTPAIDSVGWERGSNGMTININTQDPSNQSRYYKWDYNETWEINSAFPTDVKWTGGTNIIYTPAGQETFRCWKSSPSTTIMVGTSAHLQQDVISNFPAYFINLGSEKLSVRYSVLMKQQTLDRKAYEYFLLMKKNTESLGSIFDPQPSDMRGNISNVADPSEIVIGYMYASEQTEKRIFITAQQANWNFSLGCDYFLVPNKPDSLTKYLGTYLPWGTIESGPGIITDYFFSTPVCVDCTSRGGSLSKPAFW